jgi:hypothetical protein
MPGTEGFNWEYYENTMSRYRERFGNPADNAVLAPGYTAAGTPVKHTAVETAKAVIADIWPTRESLEELMNEGEGYSDGFGSCD